VAVLRHASSERWTAKEWALRVACTNIAQKTETVGFRFPMLRH
jgi:hypothetical protein